MPATKESKDNIKSICRRWQRIWFFTGFVMVSAISLAGNVQVFAQENKEEFAKHIRLAERYHDAGKYEEAKIELETALSLEPKNAEVLNSMGAIYLNLSENSSDKEKQVNNLIEARKYFTAALNIDPDFAAAWNGMAGVYYLSAENAKAISCYKKSLTLAPKRAYEVYTNLANTLRDSGQMAEAEENYTKAIELNPLYAPAHNGYAELLYNKQRLAEALSEVVEAIRLKPDYATAYYHLGLIQSAGGNKTEALKAYLLSLRYEKNPRYARDTHSLINQLGLDVNTISANDLQQFQQSLCRPLTAPSVVKEPAKQDDLSKDEQAVSSEQVLQPQLNTIHTLMSGKEWQHAVRELSNLLRKHPDDAVLLNELGLVYLNQKKYSAAVNLFKRAVISSHGQSSAICYNLGQAFLNSHELDKAREYLEKAKKLADNDPGNRALISNALGITLKQQGDIAGAQASYEQAIADGGKQYPVFHYNLAVLLEKMNKPNEAAKEFNLYLQLAPEGLNAKNAQDRLAKIRSI